jgi:hypothetical protein
MPNGRSARRGTSLRYLGRYTHRVGISNQRMVSMSDDGLVTFRTKEGKTVTLPGEDFLARFVDHVLPKHYVKIRHIGLMAASNVSTKLARARELLTGPVAAATVPARTVMTWITALLALAGVDVRHRRQPALARCVPTAAPTGHIMTRLDPTPSAAPSDAHDAARHGCARGAPSHRHDRAAGRHRPQDRAPMLATSASTSPRPPPGRAPCPPLPPATPATASTSP